MSSRVRNDSSMSSSAMICPTRWRNLRAVDLSSGLIWQMVRRKLYRGTPGTSTGAW